MRQAFRCGVFEKLRRQAYEVRVGLLEQVLVFAAPCFLGLHLWRGLCGSFWRLGVPLPFDDNGEGNEQDEPGGDKFDQWITFFSLVEIST